MKFILLLLVVILLMGIEPTYTEKDLDVMKGYFLRNEDISIKRYDINKDGKISLIDYVQLKVILKEKSK